MSNDESLKSLHGTTVRVYKFVLKHAWPVGVREVQRGLNLSSPRLASYHLEKPQNIGLVKQVQEGYAVDRVILRSFIRLQKLLIPKYLFYFVFFLSLMLVMLLIVKPEGVTAEYSLGLSGVTVAAAAFTYETVKIWSRDAI